MKIYKITEASDYLGVSINTLKTLANKVSFRGIDMGVIKWPPRIMLNGLPSTIDQAARIFGPLPKTRMYRLGFWFGRLLRRLGW
jgi:hypothetical protein